MNVMVVDIDPRKAARALCDRHLAKKCVETPQILCTALHILGVEVPPRPLGYVPLPRPPASVNWILRSQANWDWLVAHARELHREWIRRKNKVHASFVPTAWACAQEPPLDYGEAYAGMTPMVVKDTFNDTFEESVESCRERTRMQETHWIKTTEHVRMTWTPPGERPDWMGPPPPPVLIGYNPKPVR